MSYVIPLFVHLLCATFWVGGMATMHFAVRPAAVATLEPPFRLRMMTATLRRFFVGVDASVTLLFLSGVGMIMAGANSAVMLAVSKMAAQQKKLFIVPATGTARLTNEECSPYTIHYGYDTVSVARGTSSAVVKQGGKTWYYLTADYAFGAALERDTSAVITANGGKVLGGVIWSNASFQDISLKPAATISPADSSSSSNQSCAASSS